MSDISPPVVGAGISTAAPTPTSTSVSPFSYIDSNNNSADDDSTQHQQADPYFLDAFAAMIETHIALGDAAFGRRQERKAADREKIRGLVHKFAHFGLCDRSTLVCACVFVRRLCLLMPKAVNSLTATRVLAVSLMLSSKLCNDAYFRTSYFAECSNLSVKLLLQSELQFASRLDFDLSCSLEQYLATLTTLYQGACFLMVERAMSVSFAMLSTDLGGDNHKANQHPVIEDVIVPLTAPQTRACSPISQHLHAAVSTSTTPRNLSPPTDFLTYDEALAASSDSSTSTTTCEITDFLQHDLFSVEYPPLSSSSSSKEGQGRMLLDCSIESDASSAGGHVSDDNGY